MKVHELVDALIKQDPNKDIEVCVLGSHRGQVRLAHVTDADIMGVETETASLLYPVTLICHRHNRNKEEGC